VAEPETPLERLVITRETLRAGVLRKNLLKHGLPVLSEEEVAASLDRTLACWDHASDLWIFGYGSLMWNPAIHFAERRGALLRGWHRQFCLWVHLGRGSPDNPGLMLALDRGGSCHGVAFRIEAAHVRHELELLWQREMLSGAYRPRWVRLGTSDGEITGVTFTVNRRHPRYAGRLDEEQVAAKLACAGGALGRCQDYLFHTAAQLDLIAVDDSYIRRLADRVRAMADAAGSPALP
jgi:cation transport protein ChaC